MPKTCAILMGGHNRTTRRGFELTIQISFVFFFFPRTNRHDRRVPGAVDDAGPATRFEAMVPNPIPIRDIVGPRGAQSRLLLAYLASPRCWR